MNPGTGINEFINKTYLRAHKEEINYDDNERDKKLNLIKSGINLY